MGKLNQYNIDLEKISDKTVSFSYQLDQDFFDAINHDEVKKGSVKAEVTVQRTAGAFEFNFNQVGIIQIPCDRCLDEMDQEIDTTNRLIVKLGQEYSEVTDELIIHPEDKRTINIAWYLYEFIVLDIPIKHVHELDKCNEEMMAEYLKYLTVDLPDVDDKKEESDEESDDVSDGYTDPRWDALKKLKNKNK